jgi:predicted lipoprotein with Yx(FWY)xxD motif
MTRIGKLRGSLLLAIVLAAGLTAALLATRSGNASGAKTRQVVKVMRNPTLGKRILVTRSGMTLYSLSAERHGRFICTTSACVSLWKPHGPGW